MSSKAADALRAIKGGTGLGKATALPSIPNVPRTEDARVNQFLSAVKQTLETWGGDRGNELDSTVTWRNLIESGFATSDGSSGISGVVPSWAGSGGTGSATDITGKAYAGVPPAPTNLRADGAFANIILAWDEAPYSNHSYTEVWRSSVNNLGTAQLVGMAAGSVYVDNVGKTAKYFYWVKFVSTTAVKGPFNATEGTAGETARDPGYLLDLLTGQIQNSQLNKELSSRIDLITADAAVPGSVNARISEAQQELIEADSALAQQITTLSASTVSNAAAIQTEATARANGDSANATLIGQVQARLDTGDYAAVKTESSTTASALTGVQAKYSVKTDVNGYVSGFGLISTANNATPSSQFIFKADQFAFGAPGLTSAYPFVIQASATTVNGVEVPSGVYIDAAYIKNGTITSAKIGNAAIDSAKIASVDAGTITVGTLSSDRIGANSITGSKIAANTITASNIDSRGLSIKDASGNIILAAGTPLATTNISGLGALATQNSVAYSSVTGTKPPTNADNTASNVAAGIAGQGAFATLSQVTSANISTYIAVGAIGTAYIGEAAINNAKIGNAEVSTLKLAGNAVTVPTSQYSSSVVYASTNIQVLLSTTITLSQPGWIYASVAGTQYYPDGVVDTYHYLIINNTECSYVFTGGATTVCIALAGAYYASSAGTYTVDYRYKKGSGASTPYMGQRSIYAVGAMR